MQKEHNPLISIVVCCYNRAKLLPETMESIFSQTYRPVEIVVVDDGSTDGTPELMAGYGDRVKYHWQENQGIAVARTVGGRLAKGEFIAFHDDDDFMAPDRITLSLEGFRRFPDVVLSVGQKQTVEAETQNPQDIFENELGKEDVKYHLFKDGYLDVMMVNVDPIPQTTLFKKKDGDKVGWFDKRFFHGCEDTDFFATIARLGPVVGFSKVVSLVRRGHDSLTKQRLLMYYSRFLFFEKHLKDIEPDRYELKPVLRLRMRNAMEMIAYYNHENPDRFSGMPNDYLKRGLRLIGKKNILLYMWAIWVKHPLRHSWISFQRKRLKTPEFKKA